MTTTEINEYTRRLEELERLRLLPDDTLRELRKWWTATVRREKKIKSFQSTTSDSRQKNKR